MYDGTPASLRKLTTAAECSLKRLEPHRRKRLERVKEVVGFNYSDDGAVDKVPINMEDLATRVFARELMAKNPHVLVSCPHPHLKYQKLKLKLSVNHEIRRLKLHKVLNRAVVDAFFGIGIIKSGLADDEGTNGVGIPFVDQVDLDDFVVDMDARSWTEIRYIGNKYRMALSVALKNPAFNEKAREHLQATVNARYSDPSDNTAAEVGAGFKNSYDDSYEPWVELWDLYLPREKKLLTVAADEMNHEHGPLMEVDWKGPKNGPYFTLGFFDVPANLMPLPPLANLHDLHLLINALMRKAGRQAERQKTVTMVPVGNVGDGQKIVDSSDGDTITQQQPGQVTQAKFGGADPTTVSLIAQLQGIFSYMAGNLDTAGGLAPQAETLGQEQMLAAGTSKTVADMKDRVYDWTRDIVESIGYWLWNDPLTEQQLYHSPEGFQDIQIPVMFTPEDRTEDFINFDIKIEPFSLQQQTPANQLQTIMQYLQQIVFPALPMLQQSGGSLNFAKLSRIVAELSNCEYINEILEFGIPPETVGPMGRPGEGASKPAFTQRTERRINQPGASKSGRDQQFIQSMMQGASQQQQQPQAAGVAA